MQTFKSSITAYLHHKDDWIYAALIPAFSLYQVKTHLWSDYLGWLGHYTLLLLPILLWVFFTPRLRQRLPLARYRGLLALSLIVYPLSIILIDVFMVSPTRQPSADSILFIMVYGIYLGLWLSEHFKRSQRLGISLNKIGLNTMILFFMLVISVYFSLLICSNLDLWYASNSINHPIRFTQVWQNLPLFLFITLQYFGLFFCGFMLFWINRHILVEKVLPQRGTLVYLLAVAATVLLLYPILTGLYLLLPINYMGEPIIPAVQANAFDPKNGQVAFAVMLLSLPVIFIVRWHQKNNQLDALAKEKTQSELNLLKQQINPHFLFNTLNNLYALSRKKSDQAPEVILQLSDLMRYVVYKGKENLVLASEEAKYIEDYIGLQSIRLHKTLTLDMTMQIDDPLAKIEPLLLVILVENAFKHGIEPATGACYLRVTLKVTQTELVFSCENSIDPDNVIQTNPDGIGLSNLKRRLALQYPEQHQLTIKHEPDHFSAKLSLSFDQD